jgi:hypothetical protein
MTLFYDSRIRKTVRERWAKAELPQLETNMTTELPDSDILPEERAIFKDPTISITFKSGIATELWQKEDESIKQQVLAFRDAEVAPATVYNTEGEERLKLLRKYIKWVAYCSSTHTFIYHRLTGTHQACRRA